MGRSERANRAVAPTRVPLDRIRRAVATPDSGRGLPVQQLSAAFPSALPAPVPTAPRRPIPGNEELGKGATKPPVV